MCSASIFSAEYASESYKIIIYCTKKGKGQERLYNISDWVEVVAAAQSNRFGSNVPLLKAELDGADWPVYQL